MKIVLSQSGIPIRLTPERMDHISRRHPEMIGEEEHILETISDPDLIQKGDAGTKIALKYYHRTSLNEKYCTAIYREVSDVDGFIITAYLGSGYARKRRILWTR